MLHALQATEPDRYQQELTNLVELTRTNLITSLAERLNVELYKTTYRQHGDSIYHNEFYPDTPFLEVVKKGQDVRERAGSQEVEREKAEVKGFEKVQALIIGGTLSPNAKVIMISPRGGANSIYGHNFFDIYQKDPDGTITMSRFSSKSTRSEFQDAAATLDPFCQIQANPSDIDFLKSPIVTCRDVEEILSIMNRDESTMPKNKFEQIIENVDPQIEQILAGLTEAPSYQQTTAGYRALLKSADILAGRDTQFDKDSEDYIIAQMHESPQSISKFLSVQPLIETRTACGISAPASSPFSVWEFATGALTPFSKSNEDQYGTLEIHCQECGARYNRSRGKLEAHCRHCGGTKGIAC